jgi:hypothetical protein
MATFNKFNSFVEALAEKVHNLGSDALTIALTNGANAPVATNTQLSDLTQISYTNVVTTPNASRVIGVTSSLQTSGTYKLILPDMTITATGGAIAPFRYVVIYNDTATNDELIGWYEYPGGVDLTLASGESLLIDFDGSGGVLTIA